MEELISQTEGEWLLDLARTALHATLTQQPPVERKQFYLSRALREKHGLFVALWRGLELRGCIGTPFPSECLEEAVQNVVLKAAVNDARFSPVSKEELPQIKIEISILSPPAPIEPGQIELGVHGLFISEGNFSTLLLPQVPIEHGWNVATFLQQACLKAGLSPHAWQTGAQLFGFKIQVFKEKE